MQRLFDLAVAQQHTPTTGSRVATTGTVSEYLNQLAQAAFPPFSRPMGLTAEICPTRDFWLRHTGLIGVIPPTCFLAIITYAAPKGQLILRLRPLEKSGICTRPKIALGGL